MPWLCPKHAKLLVSIHAGLMLTVSLAFGLCVQVLRNMGSRLKDNPVLFVD